MRTFLLLLVLTLAFSASVPAQSVAPQPTQPTVSPAPSPAVRVLRDIPYVPDAGPRQRLDLYLPPEAGAPRPLVAYIHGGAWRAGSKQSCPARPLVALGCNVASIDYRLTQDAPFPAQIQDCKAAIRWLRANAKQYGIDPGRIGVWGESAGGHLVTMLGVTGNDRDFDTGANLDRSSAVQCVVDFFGPVDFLNWGKPAALQMPPADSAITQLLGGPFATHMALARLASPIYFVTKDASPFLIMHGDHDGLVPLRQSQELYAALQKAGVPSTFHVVAGAGHGGAAFGSPANRKLVADFLNEYLKPTQRLP